MKKINRVINVCIVNEIIQDFYALFETITNTDLTVYLTTDPKHKDLNDAKT